MWGSPINSKNGWKNWCECNDFDVERLNKSFTFTLKEGSKVLYVRNDNELQDLKLIHCFDRLNLYVKYGYGNKYCMDFERLFAVHGYDAMEVHMNTYGIYILVFMVGIAILF